MVCAFRGDVAAEFHRSWHPASWSGVPPSAREGTRGGPAESSKFFRAPGDSITMLDIGVLVSWERRGEEGVVLALVVQKGVWASVSGRHRGLPDIPRRVPLTARVAFESGESPIPGSARSDASDLFCSHWLALRGCSRRLGGVTEGA